VARLTSLALVSTALTATGVATAELATAAEETPSVSISTSYAGKKVSVVVEGSGFPAIVDREQALDGVYATLGLAGQFPETEDFEDQNDVPATGWIPASRIQDGSFTVTLSPANARLDPRKTYAVYTHQAHRHVSTDLDTETPVEIDFAKIGKATKLEAATKGKKGRKYVVTVGKRAAGKVVVKLTKGKATKKRSAQVVPKTGKATVKLPPAKGTWKAKVTFKPAKANYRAAKKTFRVKVG